MLKKALTAVLLIIVFLASTSAVRAATIFSDSFSGGYNQSLWTIYPGQFAPIPSPFGIAVDPQHADSYSSLIHYEALPRDLIVKIDMKINTSPASDMGISIRDTSTGKWKDIFLFGFGYGGVPNTAIIRDSLIWGNPSLYARGPWDISIGTHHIEVHISGTANSPITIIEDGNTLLTWNSSLDFNVNQITLSFYGVNSEFANYQLCDSNGCGAMPTPTPTITSTPTPTPTPSPLPTTKVIVIPGLGASWNNDAMWKCKATNYSGDWNLAGYAENYYKPLISALEQAGFSPKPFYYDWRRLVADNIQPLSAFINVRTLENEKVNLVGHSMGGLVGRAYLENKTTNSKLDKFLSVGSPHKGTLMAYPAWSAGEIWGDLLWRIGATVATKLCGATYLNQRQIIQNSFPSVQNLLPIFDYLRDWRSGSLKPVEQMHARNNWLPTATFVPPFWNVTVGSLVGVGVKTPKFIKVKDPNALDATLGNWEDGKPVRTEETVEGDGTVLMTSSQIDDTFNTFINKSHLGLVASPEGIEEILNFLGMPSARAKEITASLTFTEPKSALLFLSDAGAFWIIDQQGKAIKDKDGLVAVLNPQSGSYRLRLLPKAVKSRFIVAQFLEDGKTLWREYNLSNILPKFKTIIFNSVNPLEDVLK